MTVAEKKSQAEKTVAVIDNSCSTSGSLTRKKPERRWRRLTGRLPARCHFSFSPFALGKSSKKKKKLHISRKFGYCKKRKSKTLEGQSATFRGQGSVFRFFLMFLILFFPFFEKSVPFHFSCFFFLLAFLFIF